jgi:hypothetical protein
MNILSPCKIRMMKSRRMKLNTYRILVEEPEGKRQIGKPRRRCEYNINMDLRHIG